MSTLKVLVKRIDAIEKHPNADRLDLVKIDEWRVVAGRDVPEAPRYKAGDLCIYVPIDSVMPKQLEDFLFPPESKIKLEKSRVRTIKLRGAVSQGMIMDLCPELLELYPKLEKVKEGDDVTEILGIMKYEPPAHSIPSGMKVSPNKSTINNPHFKMYTDIEHLKSYPNAFTPEDTVYVTEKLHGTSARYGKLPAVAATPWQKVLLFLQTVLVRFFPNIQIFPAFQYCYGSRKVQLQGRLIKKTFYGKDLYAIISKQYDLENVLQPGECLYGEIIGSGVQGHYTYGYAEGDLGFYAYDVKVDGKYLSAYDFQTWCVRRNIPSVPHLYTGPYDLELLNKLRTGKSAINQPIKEGVVVKCAAEKEHWFGRRALKFINEDYYLQKEEPTDFH